MMNQKTVQTAEVNVTHLTLRKNLGILGMLLPIILVIGNGFKVEESISHYYYTNMSVVFTGILIAFGLFLFSYRGYPKENEVINDNWLTNSAGALAIITAFIPTACSICSPVPNGHDNALLSIIHLSCAVLFLVIMGWMSFVRFTKGATTDANKLRRKPVYRFCGAVIWLSILTLGIEYLMESNITGVDVFIGETIALVFFGIAWLIKGEALQRVGL